MRAIYALEHVEGKWTGEAGETFLMFTKGEQKLVSQILELLIPVSESEEAASELQEIVDLINRSVH